jgi:3-oxoadipate enol-lactonase
MTRTTQRLDLGNTALRYSVQQPPSAAAEEPPALLLHPWFGCSEMWQPLAQRFDAPSYAVDWYSLAATGSPDAWKPWASPAGLARAAVALLDDLGLESVDVIGNSVGGIVAQLIAAEHPTRVRRLVLIGTGASLGGRTTAFGALVGQWIEQPRQRAELAGRLVDALVAVPFSAQDRRRFVTAVLTADPDFIAAVIGAARGADLRSRLASITAPTLVIRGEHDTARTRDHVSELLAGIPDARAVEMAGLGHSPMVEDPDAVAALVLSHLRH